MKRGWRYWLVRSVVASAFGGVGIVPSTTEQLVLSGILLTVCAPPLTRFKCVTVPPHVTVTGVAWTTFTGRLGSPVVIHDLVVVVVLVLFWIGPALLVGRLAARKGRSFGLFFAAALLLVWPIVLVVTLVMPARRSN